MSQDEAIEEKTRLVDGLNKLVAEYSLVSEEDARRMDDDIKIAIAKLTGGFSPVTVVVAYVDWLSHLALSPGKVAQLAERFLRTAMQLGLYGVQSVFDKHAKAPYTVNERRMSDESWEKWPFNLFAQAHQGGKQWLQDSASGIEGIGKDNQALVAFMADQVAEIVSPANFPFSNPEVIKATKEEHGANLARGMKNLLDDLNSHANGNGDAKAESEYKVGKNIAVTPGKVIYQNDLMELIQYSPATETVGAEPVLFVPPWIMKYYILDLSAKNSMVKYLVEQGKTVFMISWKNPGVEDAGVTMNDYLRKGLLEAMDAVNAVVPKRKINAVGYCIGGTLLTIGAAYLGREGDDRLQSVSLFAAQTNFTEPGEINLFLDNSHYTFIDKQMSKDGFLSADAMGGAFAALRSGDLIWGPKVDRYFLGKEAFSNDLMTWNADGTRMPRRMHTEYLRKMYLQNELAEGEYMVDDRVISLASIQVPVFVVGTETDHVAPWKSVYKIHNLTNTDVTFLLTSGGHNAGIISGPSHPRRRYRISTTRPEDHLVSPDNWIKENEVHQGSWWPVWNEWLNDQMTDQAKPPAMGASRKGYKALRNAPGQYVMG
jgi:polyhydroxyalkanoate synthase